MPRRLTISQIDKLGKRLSIARPSNDDRRLLNELLLDYNAPMERVQDEVRAAFGVDATGRLKTEKTIVEKLQRFATRLSKMQDIAGVRIAHAMTLDAQDGLVTSILGLFASARVEDRRKDPSSGYRAVHVVVEIDDCPVEIQIRTLWQHAWADVMERLGDAVGRGIRYGEVPTDRDARLLFDTLIASSSAYAQTEANAAQVSRARAITSERHKRLLRNKSGPDSQARAKALRRIRATIRKYDRALEQHRRHQEELAAQLARISDALNRGELRFSRGTERA